MTESDISGGTAGRDATAEGAGTWTRGPWHKHLYEDGSFSISADSEGFVVVCSRNGWGHRALESIANAELITEAGTVATETGLTPRQLSDALTASRSEIERLRWINSELVDTHNSMVIHDARQADALAAANERIRELEAQAARDEEHYQAAMAMSEKHRKLWVEECQKHSNHADKGRG